MIQDSIQDSLIDPSIDPSINPKPIDDFYLETDKRSDTDPDADADINTISKPDASMAAILDPNTLMIIPSKSENSMVASSKKVGFIDISGCLKGDWALCKAQLSKIIRGFIASFFSFQNAGTVTILNQVCTVSVKRRISHWKLVYDGRLSCPFGQSSEARGYKSARGAAEAAVMLFFQINAALIQAMSG